MLVLFLIELFLIKNVHVVNTETYMKIEKHPGRSVKRQSSLNKHFTDCPPTQRPLKHGYVSYVIGRKVGLLRANNSLIKIPSSIKMCLLISQVTLPALSVSYIPNNVSEPLLIYEALVLPFIEIYHLPVQ